MIATYKPLPGGLPIWNNNPYGIPTPDVFWAMNEGTGSRVIDYSNHGRNGTLTGGATWTPEGINFPNAAGNGVVWTDDASLEGANVTEFTLFADILWDGGGDDWQYVIGKNYDAYQIYVVGSGGNLGNIGFGLRAYGSSGGQYDIETAFNHVLSPGERVFLSVTWSSASGTIYFYVNGVLTNSAARAGDYVYQNTYLFCMGKRSGTTIRDFYGNVYLGGMFKSLLTPAQIQYLYLHPYYAWQYPELWELYVSDVGTTLPPTTPSPTTSSPTTLSPTTLSPTTPSPTTLAPTTLSPTTLSPTTLAPTTLSPTTIAPTTLSPTTLAPTTLAPTTLTPTTVAPPTKPPTTLAPTTLAPTLPPTTLAPTTLAPTLAPTTIIPTTLAPTTIGPTLPPTTLSPTTAPPIPLVLRRGISNRGFSMRDGWR